MMKRRMAAALPVLLILVMGLAACASYGGKATLFEKPGTYTAVEKGVFGDEIVVKVTVDKSSILSIDTWHHETFGYGERAISIIKDAILATQSLDVDIVTGASVSSGAFLNGVKTALSEAGADMDRLAVGKPAVQYQDTTVDVVVVGGGGAGISAAIELAEGGKKVILIEKQGLLGGNTLRASTSVRGAGSVWHKIHGLPDEKAWAASLGWRAPGDTGYNADRDGPNGGYRFAELQASNIKYYIDRVNSLGGNITAKSLYAANTLNVADRSCPGPVIINALEREMARLGVDVRTNNRGSQLIKDAGSGRITGVKVDVGNHREAPEYSYTITATDAVVLASGGFAASMDMREKYFAEGSNGGTAETAKVIKLPTTNSPGNEGDGQRMAEEIGAKLVNMQVLGTNNGSLNTRGSILSLTTINNQSPVVIGPDGNVYSRNIDTWPATGQVWLVLGYKSYSNLANMRQYYNSGLLKKGDTLAELAQNCGYSGAGATNFVNAVQNVITTAEADTTPVPSTLPVTGANLRNLFWKGEAGPFYAAPVIFALHGTSGGVWINIKCQALDSGGNVIPGLYAAGCVSNSGATPMITTSNMESPMAFGYAAAQVILGNPPYVRAW